MYNSRPNKGFLGHAHGMQKFPGQGLDTCHNSDKAGSLTTGLPGNSPGKPFFFFFDGSRHIDPKDHRGKMKKNFNQTPERKRKVIKRAKCYLILNYKLLNKTVRAGSVNENSLFLLSFAMNLQLL